MRTDNAEVLVVDDDEVVRTLLAEMIRRQGHNVTVAKDGAEALALARSKKFELVLLDILMPGMDGYAVLEQFKADAALRTLPVVMLSAVEDSASVVKCVKLGAEDFVFKPFNSVLLKARVDSCLERKRLQEQARKFLEGAGSKKVE